VQVWVQPEGDQVRVSVQDDGQGFNPSAQPQAAHGLLGMRYRVEAEGGRLVLSSAPGQGTRITAWLPVTPAPAPAGEAQPQAPAQP
jgi:signal transduction histidine kinase